VMRRGLLESGASFLEKPFSPQLLARTVSEMLAAKRRGPPAARSRAAGAGEM
jgi:FixJ family two-component response regulator